MKGALISPYDVSWIKGVGAVNIIDVKFCKRKFCHWLVCTFKGQLEQNRKRSFPIKAITIRFCVCLFMGN